tara:strand:+ start:260 stop:463 length:204 start_codon:yes stop_codon:yes gene_type:complete
MRFRVGDRVVPVFASHKAGVITEVKSQAKGQWSVGGPTMTQILITIKHDNPEFGESVWPAKDIIKEP